MFILRLLFMLLLFWLPMTTGQVTKSTKERIELHKAWLDRRAALKALYYNQLNDSNSYDRIFLPNHNRKVVKFRKENELLSTWKELKSLKSAEKPKYQLKHKEPAIRNEVLQSDTENEIISTTKPIDQLATDSVNILRVTRPINDDTTWASSTEPLSTTTEYTTVTETDDLYSSIAATTENLKGFTSHSKEKMIGPTIAGSQQKGNDTMRISKMPINLNKVRPNAIWGKWQPWTECSRSCGGGVMSQSRQCLNRATFETGNGTVRNRTSKNCIGLFKRYRICNEQSCPETDIDFREQQCTQYNNQSFRGKRYEWEAYLKDDAECELNCKPVGMSYFATLNDRTIDGTTCFTPINFARRNHSGRAMCVDGVCKAVHSSGIITGAFMNNGAVRCGVNICRPISGIFTKNNLPSGYIHIATIPAGASNISITELKNSLNYLVLKQSDDGKYLINGDYSLSHSGLYKGAGTTFDYRRIDELKSNKKAGVTEWITSTGPTTESLNLMILTQEENPGVKYEYLLPLNTPHSSSSSEENNSIEIETIAPTTDNINRHSLKSGLESTAVSTVAPNIDHTSSKQNSKYIWKVVGFSPCNKSCGGGIQSPNIRCVRENSVPSKVKYFVNKRCMNQPKPVLNENIMRCNTQPCPAEWKIGEWSSCQCGKWDEKDYQTREVKCMQELSNDLVLRVNEGACLEEIPVKRQICKCPSSRKQEKYKHHQHKHRKHDEEFNRDDSNDQSSRPVKHHNHRHRNGNNKQSITLIGNTTLGKRVHLHVVDYKKAGIWLASDWNEQCSTTCGDGVQYRSIFCDRSAPNIDRCDLRLTPETTRQCTVLNQCDAGDWFIGPWGQCTGDCFSLLRSRSVLCIREEQTVDDSICIDPDDVEGTVKPPTTENCTLTDVADCRPRWHIAEWTECTKKCGGGTQKRMVKCLEPNLDTRQMKETDNCKYSERPSGFRQCNTHNCETTDSLESSENRSKEDPKINLIQNDITPECVDKFPNCHIVIRAQLCTYEYYINNCCAACKEATYGLQN